MSFLTDLLFEVLKKISPNSLVDKHQKVIICHQELIPGHKKGAAASEKTETDSFRCFLKATSDFDQKSEFEHPFLVMPIKSNSHCLIRLWTSIA